MAAAPGGTGAVAVLERLAIAVSLLFSLLVLLLLLAARPDDGAGLAAAAVSVTRPA